MNRTLMMTSSSISGQNKWVQVLFVGIRLFESQFSPLQLRDHKYACPIPETMDIHTEGFGPEILLRTAFNRIYYGTMQILIDYYKIEREKYKSGIHYILREAIPDKYLKQILNELCNISRENRKWKSVLKTRRLFPILTLDWNKFGLINILYHGVNSDKNFPF